MSRSMCKCVWKRVGAGHAAAFLWIVLGRAQQRAPTKHPSPLLPQRASVSACVGVPAGRRKEMATGLQARYRPGYGPAYGPLVFAYGPYRPLEQSYIFLNSDVAACTAHTQIPAARTPARTPAHTWPAGWFQYIHPSTYLLPALGGTKGHKQILLKKCVGRRPC